MTGRTHPQMPAPAGDRLTSGLRAWLAWHAQMGMTDLDEDGWQARPEPELGQVAPVRFRRAGLGYAAAGLGYAAWAPGTSAPTDGGAR